MIDAAKFSTAFTAFWNMATPTCEHFIRNINLNLYDRFDAPMVKADTSDRAFIAEFGFSLFVETMWPSVGGRSNEEIVLAAREMAVKRLAKIQGINSIPKDISSEQKREIGEIASRLCNFFTVRGSAIPRPVLPGCGFIDRAEADIIYNSTIFEIKTVDRGFRSNDIRQLITYAALNKLSKSYLAERVGLLNPRAGTFFELDIDIVSREISGKSSSELFDDIYEVISSGGISR